MCTEIIMLLLSSCWKFIHMFQWSTWLYDLPITKDSYLHQRSNQVDLHKRLKYPTKWVYTFQYNYPTKWVYKFDSATQPSGFTNLTQLPNQVSLQILTSPYMTEYYNFTSRVSTRPFHRITSMNFYDQNQKDLKKENIFQTHHNANNALYSARLMLPLNLCIQASFPYD